MAFDDSSIREDTLVTFHWSYWLLKTQQKWNMFGQNKNWIPWLPRKQKHDWNARDINPHESPAVMGPLDDATLNACSCDGVKLTKIAETQYTSNAVKGLITLFHIRVVSKCYVGWHHSQCNLHLFERQYFHILGKDIYVSTDIYMCWGLCIPISNVSSPWWPLRSLNGVPNDL